MTERGAPFQLRLRELVIDRARTSYVDEGDGRPVLLLHGAPFTSLGFVRLIRELAQHHRVVAPDFPGFGGSECPPGFLGTLEEYVSFVVAFVRAVDLRDAVLYGNDSSGATGIAALLRLEPGRIAGLVVADTVPIPLTGSAALVRFALRRLVGSRVLRFLNRKLNLLPWLVATVAPWLRPFSREERRALVREFDTVEKRDRVLEVFVHMGTDEAFMQRTARSACEQLGDLPVLILFGQLDPMRLIGGVRRFRAMFPRNTVAIVPKEEHFPILASGDAVGRMVHAWIEGTIDA